MAAGLLMVNAGRAEQWTIVRSKYFTVVTSSWPYDAQQWAGQLERFRVAMGQIYPAHSERLRPVTMVIFPDSASFRPYKMLNRLGQPAAIGGFFVQSEYVSAIAVAVDVSPSETRRVIFHEATHWFQSTRDDPLPAWLEEGIAEVFSTFVADGKNYMVGDSIHEHVRYLRAGNLPKLTQLMGLTRDSLDYNQDDRTGKFYAESWLFVHWNMFGEGSAGAQAVPKYLELLKRAKTAEQAFAGAFGGDYKTVGQRLERYLASGKYTRKAYPLRVEDLCPIEPPRPATEVEVEVALGAVALGGRGPQAALPHLRRATELDPKNVQGWELLGAAALGADDKATALAAYDQAARLGSQIAMVWCNRAALRQEAEHPAGEFITTTDASTLTADAADFRKAIDLDPRYQPAYGGLAGVEYSAEPFDPADVQRFERGRALYPDDGDVAVGGALAHLRAGDKVRGEAELKELLMRESLPKRDRQLAENAFEGEKLRVVQEHIRTYNEERRFAELVAELDRALADDAIGPQNRQTIRSARKQAEELRRMDAAVQAMNDGHPADAIPLLRSVLDDSPSSWMTRNEAERLLKQARKLTGDED